MSRNKCDPAVFAQRKTERDEYKTLPPGTSILALKALVDRIAKVLGLA